MASDLDDVLARFARTSSTPSPWSILSLEVHWSFWDVLAYEHDGMAEQAAMARERLNRCVQRLRDVYDPNPVLGPLAADEMTDRAIRQARAGFAEDVRHEACREWRDQRGRPRSYR